MAAGDGGSIINVSSIAAVAADARPSCVYAGAKAALNAMTVGLARAYAPKVRANVIMPGPFLTDISQGLGPRGVHGARGRGTIPLQRGGQADEIVGAALYLASAASSYTTGVGAEDRRRRRLVAGVTDPEGVDLGALGAWMDEAGPADRARSSSRAAGRRHAEHPAALHPGRSTYVLRRPPLHKRGNSDETMRREARVLAALAGSDVPHPRLVAACPDVEVLGAAFYLMEPVDGTNPNVELGPAYDDPSWRHQLGLAMADGAAAVGAFDHVAAGLSDLGKADGWLERQVPRWRAHLEGYREFDGYGEPDIPGVEQVGAVAGGQPAADAGRPASSTATTTCPTSWRDATGRRSPRSSTGS